MAPLLPQNEYTERQNSTTENADNMSDDSINVPPHGAPLTPPHSSDDTYQLTDLPTPNLWRGPNRSSLANTVRSGPFYTSESVEILRGTAGTFEFSPGQRAWLVQKAGIRRAESRVLAAGEGGIELTAEKIAFDFREEYGEILPFGEEGVEIIWKALLQADTEHIRVQSARNGRPESDYTAPLALPQQKISATCAQPPAVQDLMTPIKLKPQKSLTCAKRRPKLEDTKARFSNTFSKEEEEWIEEMMGRHDEEPGKQNTNKIMAHIQYSPKEVARMFLVRFKRCPGEGKDGGQALIASTWRRMRARSKKVKIENGEGSGVDRGIKPETLEPKTSVENWFNNCTTEESREATFPRTHTARGSPSVSANSDEDINAYDSDVIQEQNVMPHGSNPYTVHGRICYGECDIEMAADDPRLLPFLASIEHDETFPVAPAFSLPEIERLNHGFGPLREDVVSENALLPGPIMSRPEPPQMENKRSIVQGNLKGFLKIDGIEEELAAFRINALDEVESVDGQWKVHCDLGRKPRSEP